MRGELFPDYHNGVIGLLFNVLVAHATERFTMNFVENLVVTLGTKIAYLGHLMMRWAIARSNCRTEKEAVRLREKNEKWREEPDHNKKLGALVGELGLFTDDVVRLASQGVVRVHDLARLSEEEFYKLDLANGRHQDIKFFMEQGGTPLGHCK